MTRYFQHLMDILKHVGKPVRGNTVGAPLLTGLLMFVIVTCSAQPHAQPKQDRAGSTYQAGGETLLTLPPTDMSRVDAEVGEQIQYARESLESLSRENSDPKTLADAFGQLGTLYHAYEFLDSAETCYTNAMRLDPNQFQWSYYLALIHQFNGRPAEALELYRQIEPIHPEPLLIQVRMGDAYQALERLSAARNTYLQAYYLRPDSATLQARLGELALKEKQYSSAITFLTAALASQPGADQLHHPLAMAYRGLGDTRQASTHLELRGTAELQPYDPWLENLKNQLKGERAYLLSGQLALSTGRTEDSIQAFRTALKYNQESINAHINLGTALTEAGQTEEAISHFIKALELEPENLAAHYNLGYLYAYSNRSTEAISHLQKVVQANPEDATTHLLLAQTLETDLRYEEAMDLYRRTVLIEPTTERAWMGGVSLLLRKGDYAGALGVLGQAREVLPDSGLITHALAKLLAASPDLSIRNGQQALPLALAVYQSAPSALHAQTLAMAFAESGQCDEAAKWQQQALDELSTNDTSRQDEFQDQLDYYNSNQPCRIESQ